MHWALLLLSASPSHSLPFRLRYVSSSSIPKQTSYVYAHPSSCLHHLLSPLCDTSVIYRLWSTTSCPRPTTHTKQCQYQSLTYGLHSINHLVSIHSFMLNPAVILDRSMFFCFSFFIVLCAYCNSGTVLLLHSQLCSAIQPFGHKNVNKSLCHCHRPCSAMGTNLCGGR